jgi:ketosteroid isomerase-like protein
MAPHREAAQGPKAIEQVLREFGELGYEDLRLETTRVDYSGDMAAEVGRYTVAVRLANGTTIADRGKFLHAWRRVGAWLMIAACWSSNLPPVK